MYIPGVLIEFIKLFCEFIILLLVIPDNVSYVIYVIFDIVLFIKIPWSFIGVLYKLFNIFEPDKDIIGVVPKL